MSAPYRALVEETPERREIRELQGKNAWLYRENMRIERRLDRTAQQLLRMRILRDASIGLAFGAWFGLALPHLIVWWLS